MVFIIHMPKIAKNYNNCIIYKLVCMDTIIMRFMLVQLQISSKESLTIK
jgi:hypothetical protein